MLKLINNFPGDIKSMVRSEKKLKTWFKDKAKGKIIQNLRKT
jgi:hypothetical protein